MNHGAVNLLATVICLTSIGWCQSSPSSQNSLPPAHAPQQNDQRTVTVPPPNGASNSRPTLRLAARPTTISGCRNLPKMRIHMRSLQAPCRRLRRPAPRLRALIRPGPKRLQLARSKPRRRVERPQRNRNLRNRTMDFRSLRRIRQVSLRFLFVSGRSVSGPSTSDDRGGFGCVKKPV
jgi:hypothetical protein